MISRPDAYRPVKPYDPLDLERAKRGLSVYDKKIKQLKKEMDHFVVNSDRSASACTEKVARAHGLIKAMKEKLDALNESG